LHVADAATEAPAARASDVDDAAPRPLVAVTLAAEGRWAATRAGNLDAARA
jgi:hypothetical protein